MDKMSKDKVVETKQTHIHISKQIEIRNEALLKEKYSKATLLGLHDRLQSDIILLSKEIFVIQDENGKINKMKEKERLMETRIKENVNQLHNKARKVEKVIILYILHINIIIFNNFLRKISMIKMNKDL